MILKSLYDRGCQKICRLKKISLAEDETFHPQIWAASMESVSNFIIIEKYVENHEAATWNKVVLQALKDLPVQVIQVSSD